jgi:hypothetical protein
VYAEGILEILPPIAVRHVLVFLKIFKNALVIYVLLLLNKNLISQLQVLYQMCCCI